MSVATANRSTSDLYVESMYPAGTPEHGGFARLVSAVLTRVRDRLGVPRRRDGTIPDGLAADTVLRYERLEVWAP